MRKSIIPRRVVIDGEAKYLDRPHSSIVQTYRVTISLFFQKP